MPSLLCQSLYCDLGSEKLETLSNNVLPMFTFKWFLLIPQDALESNVWKQLFFGKKIPEDSSCLCSLQLALSLWTPSASAHKSPHIIITTYGLITSSPNDFVDKSCGFDYIILDEAQKVKNHNAEVSKNIRIVANHEDSRRLILTGTPIMNNLLELWALFDFVTAGRLLGPVFR